MRLAFMGTPAFAVPALQALAAAYHVVAVYTQPPRPAGRGKAALASPVAVEAARLGLPVRTPATLRDPDTQADWSALGLDCAIVAAYGLILPAAILAAPAHGCLNIHASLLPRWRGAAPIQRAILAGDQNTGVMIMVMERGLDTGPIVATATTPVAAKTAGELTSELAQLGAKLLLETLAHPTPWRFIAQPEVGTTYATKIEKAEARLDFARPAADLERAVRAFNPAPGAWFEAHGERIKLLAAEVVDAPAQAPPGTILDHRLTIACAPGALHPVRLQRAGRAAMSAAELLRGLPIPPGTRLCASA